MIIMVMILVFIMSLCDYNDGDEDDDSMEWGVRQTEVQPPPMACYTIATATNVKTNGISLSDKNVMRWIILSHDGHEDESDYNIASTTNEKS